MDNEEKKTFEHFSVGKEQAKEVFEKFVAIAKPETVYGAPVVSDQQTVITASEVLMSLGFGHGMGHGSVSTKGETGTSPESSGGGGGSGGGGFSMARPVAAISINPNGVTVIPIIDRTKVAIAALTAIGSIFLVIGRMLRKRR